jgi:hypothetical protein
MQPSTIITPMRRRIAIVFFSYELSACGILLAVGKTSALHSTRTPYVDRYESWKALESDSRSDVTSNDASVKVSDALDGAQAATTVLARKQEKREKGGMWA